VVEFLAKRGLVQQRANIVNIICNAKNGFLMELPNIYLKDIAQHNNPLFLLSTSAAQLGFSG
jgi:hypothetical protein